ncbi:hypothetical protein EKM05_04490 [Flavobacterium sp. GSP27]|uniref:hypothetical protein n=1 Tax=Flavobacterium sp. GSP27 TaxID=2497489 RepID=UPI000F83602F|nr:hypothetical protein [Flavobacterium sp. GSP27]RTZ10586.1 hypothetical protein EKM05_04490 [Flavobacterium sp. GSP27]
MKRYRNNFGALDSNEITLFIHNKKQKIEFQDILKIRFIKRQKYLLNYLVFFVSVLLMFFIKNNSLSSHQHLIFLFSSLILLLISFFFKSFEYKFILIKKNDFIIIDVPIKLSMEAENSVNQYHLVYAEYKNRTNFQD